MTILANQNESEITSTNQWTEFEQQFLNASKQNDIWLFCPTVPKKDQIKYIDFLRNKKLKENNQDKSSLPQF